MWGQEGPDGTSIDEGSDPGGNAGHPENSRDFSEGVLSHDAVNQAPISHAGDAFNHAGDAADHAGDDSNHTGDLQQATKDDLIVRRVIHLLEGSWTKEGKDDPGTTDIDSDRV